MSVVRYYWDYFLTRHRGDIRGHALEIGGTATIERYGGDDLTRADALDLTAHSSEIRIVADLSRADDVPADTYDCFVNQFTTAVIYDIEAALYHAVRLLKPGGVLLINFWCVDSYLDRGLDMGTGAPMYMYWWFTPIHVENLLQRLSLTSDDYQLEVYGNLLTRMAFLMKMPAAELTSAELDHRDPRQPLLICARVKKPAQWHAEKPVYRDPIWKPSLEPDRMTPGTGHYGSA